MMKRKISLGFVTLAMLLTFAHAILPHHHHDGFVCFKHHHSEACVCGHAHGFAPSNECTCHHHHDDGETCPLTSQVYIEYGVEDFSHLFNQTDHTAQTLLGVLSEDLVAQRPTGLPSLLDSDLPSHFKSQYQKSATPLRAPPFRA